MFITLKLKYTIYCMFTTRKNDTAETTTQLKLSNLVALSWMENDAIKNLGDAGEKSLLIIPVNISLCIIVISGVYISCVSGSDVSTYLWFLLLSHIQPQNYRDSIQNFPAKNEQKISSFKKILNSFGSLILFGKKSQFLG